MTAIFAWSGEEQGGVCASEGSQLRAVEGDFPGPDQSNIIIPLRLAGRGDVDLIFTVDGIQANTVTININ